MNIVKEIINKMIADMEWHKTINDDCQYQMGIDHCIDIVRRHEKDFEISYGELQDMEYGRAIDDFLHTAETKLTDMILQNQGRLNFASGLACANHLLDEVSDQLKEGKYEQ